MVGLSAQIEWNTDLGDDALLSKRGSSRPVIKIYCFSSTEPVGGERIVLMWSSCVLLVILLFHISLQVFDCGEHSYFHFF
jgi:hypothetical protein